MSCITQRYPETVSHRRKNMGSFVYRTPVLEPPLPNQVSPTEQRDLREPGFLRYRNWGQWASGIMGSNKVKFVFYTLKVSTDFFLIENSFLKSLTFTTAVSFNCTFLCHRREFQRHWELDRLSCVQAGNHHHHCEFFFHRKQKSCELISCSTITPPITTHFLFK